MTCWSALPGAAPSYEQSAADAAATSNLPAFER